MRAIRQLFIRCRSKAGRDVSSGRFVRASEPERIAVIKRAAEKANEDQAAVIKRAESLLSKSVR